jgi:CRISPR-associated protein Csm3
MRFQRNLIIRGEISVETGLRIGGSSESIEIGGVENIVIRDPKSDLPYIPGSSLKGKMRSLMELSDPKVSGNILNSKGKPCECGNCIVCKVFGTASKEVEHGPTRLIIRDSFPTEETIKNWSSAEDIVQGAEVKYENTINRLTSEANPRPMERVPRGSKFNFEMIFSVYTDEDYKNFNTVLESLKLLEDNYLGGSGTRGYGKIKFENIKIIKRTLDYYKGTADSSEIQTKNTVDEILRDSELLNKLKS